MSICSCSLHFETQRFDGMTQLNELTPWLELAQHWVYQFINFLRHGASYSTAYEMFRFVALPATWLFFFAQLLRQASALHKFNNLTTKPSQYPELPFTSCLMWVIPLWMSYSWMEPTNGAYLVPTVAFLAHVCLWYSGLYQLRMKPLHVYVGAAAMVLSSLWTFSNINVDYRRGLPQEPLVLPAPSSKIVAQMLMHRCFETEGCLNRPDMASRVAVRQMSTSLSQITMRLISDRCRLVGHSPLGIFGCDGAGERSLRTMFAELFPTLPSAAADCHAVDWAHVAWQPNGFWPNNPPLSVLSAKEETVLNCGSNIGFAGKPFIEGLAENKFGRYLVPAQHVMHHDWWAMKLMWAEDVVNAPGVEE